jgi:predicted permease
MFQSVIHVFGTLAPIYLILALGAWLRHIGFIPATLASGLNRLVFNIALPCFIVRSIANAPINGGWERAALALMGGTFIVFLFAWFLAPAMGISKFSRPSFCQAAFRSNNAYIGIPVMLFAFNGRPDLDAMQSLAMLTLAPCLIVYNVFAVAILTRADDETSFGRRAVKVVGGMCKNPLIIASVVGCALLVLRLKTGLALPAPIDKTVMTLGQMATSGSILALGASLTPAILRANLRGAHWTALLKLVVAPLAGLALAFALSLPPLHRFVVVCYLACPSAVASFVMAQAMGGDADIAGSSVALTTIYSFISLSAVLLWAMPPL